MRLKRVIGVLLAVTTMCGTFVSCTSGTSASKTNQFEIIRQAADAYLSAGKAEVTISGKDLHDLIIDDEPKNDPRILEVRDFRQHTLGHVCDAICAPWNQLFLTLAPDKLDEYFVEHDQKSQNKQIVVYSYTGQEGGGPTTAYLNMLGYDAINLKWGYTCWQFCPNAAPGAFITASSKLPLVTNRLKVGFNSIGVNYRTETKVNEATTTYKLPSVNNTDSQDPWEIIRAAASKWATTLEILSADELSWGGADQKHFFVDTDINPSDLLKLLNDSDPGNDPFILSVQPEELYAKGHIEGAVRFPINDVAKTENLQKLPPDRPIVVVSNDGMSGSQVAGILCILGYNALNLKFGMTAWTKNEEIAPGRFHIWEPDAFGVVFRDVLGYEICWIDTPSTETLPMIEGWQRPDMAAEEGRED